MNTDDPILGALKDSGDCLEGSLKHNGKDVPISMDADGAQVAELISLARDVATRLGAIDADARRCASDKLLDVYNDSWRSYIEVGDDGKNREVSGTILDSTAFREGLSLASVSVLGSGVVTLYYHDGGMFAGHSVMVESFEGTDFSDASTQLFG